VNVGLSATASRRYEIFAKSDSDPIDLFVASKVRVCPFAWFQLRSVAFMLASLAVALVGNYSGRKRHRVRHHGARRLKPDNEPSCQATPRVVATATGKG